MTPKEKAKELFEKYFNIIDNSHPLTDIDVSAKKCALIAIDELIDLSHTSTWISTIRYYKEVKQEIEKL